MPSLKIKIVLVGNKLISFNLLHFKWKLWNILHYLIGASYKLISRFSSVLVYKLIVMINILMQAISLTMITSFYTVELIVS